MALTGRQDDGGFKLYHYDPSTAAAVIFVALFLATTVVHGWQMIRSRCRIAIPLVVGGLLEVVGYIGRAISSRESPDWTLAPYIVQAIFLLVAPALFAATIYMEFGHLVTGTGARHYTLINHKWITKLFVTGDVLSFFLQSGGGGYQSSGTQKALDLGSHIIVAGLFLQLVFFGVFMVLAVNFHWRILCIPTAQSEGSFPWRKHIYTMYAASLLILVRSIFRVAEYLQGNNGSLLRHEAYIYGLDAMLMLATMVVFNVTHPNGAANRGKEGEGNNRDTLDIHLERYYRL